MIDYLKILLTIIFLYFQFVGYVVGPILIVYVLVWKFAIADLEIVKNFSRSNDASPVSEKNVAKNVSPVSEKNVSPVSEKIKVD